MFKFMLYIIRREIVPMIIGCGLIVLTRLIFVLDIFPNHYLMYDLMNLGVGTVSFLVVMIILERLSQYIEKNMLFSYREHFLLLPYESSMMIGAIYIIEVIEMVILISVIALVGSFGMEMWLGSLILLIPCILALHSLALMILVIISKYTDKYTNASIILMAVVMIVTVLIGIGVNTLHIEIPFFYNWLVGLLSSTLIVFGLTYYVTCYLMGKRIDGKVVRIAVSLIFLFGGMLLYGIGQGTAYANRRVDNIDLSFEMDESVIGTWTVINMFNSPDIIELADEAWFDKHKLKTLEFKNDGTTNKAWQWTKGHMIDEEIEVVHEYEFVEIDGTTYMVLTYKSRLYVYNQDDLYYYLLEKK